MSGAVGKLGKKFEAERKPAIDRVQRESFEEFLREDAMVPIGRGRYGKYTFEGREALLAPVRTIDLVMGSHTGKPLKTSTVVLAGGAQFGKTIMELNLAAYASAQQFLNFGLYLPDDKLADVVIDTKFRPDVVNQIPWLAQMTQIGKAVNASGKQVNSKKVASMTDGVRSAAILVSGLQKPTTTISLDIAARDEEDDIPPKNAKFVKGRMTNSEMQIQLIIGTQRVHGRGQQRAWEDASQGVFLFGIKSEAWQYEVCEVVDAVPEGFFNLEEEFPQIVRHAVTGNPRIDDPKLQWTGDFRHSETGEIVSEHLPDNVYYLAHPMTGEPLERRIPVVHHRNPETIKRRLWSYRISQLGIAAIDLGQIVNQFTLAVEDTDEMTVFRCDVLALPKSMAQKITPEIIQRAQGIEPYEVRLVREPQRAAFAGLDMGDQCWLHVREIEDPARKRTIYAAKIAMGDVTRRIVSLANSKLWDCLFLDQRPEASVSREIASVLNGLHALNQWPKAPALTDKEADISFPSGLRWNGRMGQWQNLKCAVVRFDRKKLGQGISHEFDKYEVEGVERFVPLINCNREETIDRAVREFLTPDEGVNEYYTDAKGEKFMRVLPSMLLPSGQLPIVKILERHLISGSEREREDDGSLGDYKDKIENHLLLADAYSALAETIGESCKTGPFVYQAVEVQRDDLGTAALGGGVLM